VITSFGNGTAEDLFQGRNTKEARKLPRDLWRVAKRKLDMLNAAHRLGDLAIPPGNHLEALSGDRAGQHSIRINVQYRICFVFKDANAEGVEVTDYH
jgi:toxin HigB-1